MIFKPELAEAILRGEKTATRRKFSDNRRSPWYRGGCAYTVGQIFAVQPGRGVGRIGDARVTAVYKQHLGNITAHEARMEGFKGRRGTNVRQVFFEAWAEINGHVEPREVVWVVVFELVEAVSTDAA